MVLISVWARQSDPHMTATSKINVVLISVLFIDFLQFFGFGRNAELLSILVSIFRAYVSISSPSCMVEKNLQPKYIQ